MQDRGVNMAHLRRLVDDSRLVAELTPDDREYLDRAKSARNPHYNQPVRFEHAPTWLVVDFFVKPRTQIRRVPFVDVISKHYPDLGGPRRTTHFVSHSWQQVFVDLVSALDSVDEAGGASRSISFLDLLPCHDAR